MVGIWLVVSLVLSPRVELALPVVAVVGGLPGSTGAGIGSAGDGCGGVPGSGAGVGDGAGEGSGTGSPGLGGVALSDGGTWRSGVVELSGAGMGAGPDPGAGGIGAEGVWPIGSAVDCALAIEAAISTASAEVIFKEGIKPAPWWLRRCQPRPRQPGSAAHGTNGSDRGYPAVTCADRGARALNV